MARSDFNERLSAKQTAFNQAGALAVAFVAGGLVEDKEEARAELKSIAAEIFDELISEVGALESAPTRTPQRAASQSPSDPGDYTFSSGKHDGKTISEVSDEAPDYLEWYADNVRKGEAVEYVKAYLDNTRAGV